MDVTIRDLRNMPELRGMRLIAGESGLDNVVTKGGFLDYEYDRGHKEKYFHRNFVPGQFVLTSFLYAKDNESAVIDAVKRLHLRGCSGLAVKNIYKLHFRDNVLRFADANRFPIFILPGREPFFEDIVFAIADRVRQTSSVHYGAGIVNQILHSGLDAEHIEGLARALNPSFGEETEAAYFHFAKRFSSADFLALVARDGIANLLAPSDAVLYYKNGFILVHSRDAGQKREDASRLERYVKAVLAATKASLRIGVSVPHHNLFEMRDVLTESIYAALAPLRGGRPWNGYADLGVYALYFHSAREPAGRAFSDGIVAAIRVHDAENGASLLRTSREFVLADGEIRAAARVLGVHANTVRYRLESVNALIARNILTKAGYEEFSAAVKIDLCREALTDMD